MRESINIGLVVYELTDACNQACRFCYNYWKGEECYAKPDAPNFRQARRTLRKLLRQASVGSISFSGGEPMLMPRIHDLAFRARLSGAQVNILTNGTCLKDDDIEIFENLGITAIQIPILAPTAELHDHITQLSGSWERAMAAARKVARVGSEWLVPVLILNKLNAPYIEDILTLYHSAFGTTRAMVNRFNIGGLGKHHAAELSLTKSELKEAFHRVDRKAGELGMQIHNGVCTPLCVLNPKEYRNVTFTHCTTDLTTRPLTVNYRGEVRFCNHSPRILGNIYDRPLSEILATTQHEGYFDSVPTLCGDCKHWERCRGGCRAAAEQLYGTFAMPDPIISQP